MVLKICKQCGELKPHEQFRKYYGGRKGTYRTCKLCEKVNARYKYLNNKGDEMSDEEATELEKIEKLYSLQRAAGLQPPNTGQCRRVPVADSLDEMLGKYANVAVLTDDGAAAPAELQKWLTEPLTEEPDYYIDEVYEDLQDQFRPLLRITADNQPVYDDTYKATLDKVLSRFYEYEEGYWDGE